MTVYFSSVKLEIEIGVVSSVIPLATESGRIETLTPTSITNVILAAPILVAAPRNGEPKKTGTIRSFSLMNRRVSGRMSGSLEIFASFFSC